MKASLADLLGEVWSTPWSPVVSCRCVRVIYQLQDAHTVRVVAIRHRGSAYGINHASKAGRSGSRGFR